jgi:hypothetical protein
MSTIRGRTGAAVYQTVALLGRVGAVVYEGNAAAAAGGGGGGGGGGGSGNSTLRSFPEANAIRLFPIDTSRGFPVT